MGGDLSAALVAALFARLPCYSPHILICLVTSFPSNLGCGLACLVLSRAARDCYGKFVLGAAAHENRFWEEDAISAQ
eukprot:1316839-Amphidinium_carterae.1